MMLTYCHVETTPELVGKVKIIDKATGQEVDEVIECSVGGGFALCYVTDDDGKVMICDRNPPCDQCGGDLHERVKRLISHFEIEYCG